MGLGCEEVGRTVEILSASIIRVHLQHEIIDE